MSSWRCVTFDTADRPLEAVEAELESAVDGDTAYGDGGLHTYEYRGNLVWRWKRNGPLEVHDVAVPRALTIDVNDTVDCGWGQLYERIDGVFVEVDSFDGREGNWGTAVVDYFAANYGLVGDRGV